MSRCSQCNLRRVCSDERKKRHADGCGQFEESPTGWFPGGTPPRKFCTVCVHEPDKCISSSDIECFALNRNMSVEEARDYLLFTKGYVLSEYSMLEGHCMMSCDRFEEKE